MQEGILSGIAQYFSVFFGKISVSDRKESYPLRKLSAIGLICLGLTFPIRAGSYQRTQDQTTPSALSQLPASESAQPPATQNSTVPTAQPETTLESATILKATTRLVMLDIVAVRLQNL